MNPTVRIYTRTGIGNQLQFIPVIKSLVANGYTVYSDSKVLSALLPEHLHCTPDFRSCKYDYGILLYHQGLPDAWRARKECHQLLGFPFSFKIVNHNEIPILSWLFLANRDKFDENIPEIENNIRLLHFWGIHETTIDYTVPIPRNPETNVIGISAGSGAHPKKRWQHFSDLINALPYKHFRIFGTEKTLNGQILANTLHSNARIIETENLKDAAEEIIRCEIFISNDNGLMHLADLLQVPTIALFGMTNIHRNRPWNNPNHSISLNLYCSPCYRNGKIHCINPKRYACMDIPVTTVVTEIKKLENSL